MRTLLLCSLGLFSACTGLLNLDPDDEANKENPCDPGASDRGAADCALGFWCNPESSTCEKGDVYLPVYTTMPPSYAGTCLEPEVNTCFDGRGACTIHHRELKDDQVEVRDGDVYAVRWANGAACYYMNVLFAGTWDWPDIFERSWCVSSPMLGDQTCFINELSSITAYTQAEYSVGTHIEGSRGAIAYADRGDPYNSHANWRLRCPDSDETVNYASNPLPEPQWLRDGNARVALFQEAVQAHCELAEETPLSEWPPDANLRERVTITEADRFPGDITEGDEANVNWSGLAVPTGDNTQVVRIDRLTLKRTNTLPKVIDGGLELTIVHSGANTSGNVRGMLAHKDHLVLHLGGGLWRQSHCSPKLTLDLEGWRSSGFARIPTVIEGCGLESTMFLCPGVRQDCRAD